MTQPVDPPTSNGPPSVETVPTVRPSKARATPLPLENVEQLIALVLAKKGKPVTIRAAARVRLANGPALSPEALLRLLEQARADALMAVPSRLLRVAQSFGKYAIARREIVSFVGQALRAHPVFRTDGNAARPLDAVDAAQAFATLSRLDLFKLGGLTELGITKKPQILELQRNAFYALAAWLFETRDNPIADLAALLNIHLWRLKGDAVRSDADRLAKLLDLRDSSALGIACESFARSAREHEQAASEARARETTARLRVDELTSRLRDAEHAAADLNSRLEASQREQARRDKAHADEISHGLDALESVRAGAFRALKAEVSLLEEGLQALRLDQPRTHVMVDHAERAIAGLRREMKRLEPKA